MTDYSSRSNAIRAARKFLGNQTAQVGVDFNVIEGSKPGTLSFELIAAAPTIQPDDDATVRANAEAEICAAADSLDDNDGGFPAFLRREQPTGDALIAYQSRLAQIAKLGAPDRELVLRKSDVKKAEKADAPPKESKIGAVLVKAQSEAGVTTAEIHSMTGWKKIGGFFTAAKRHNLALTKKRENKVTTYFAAPAAQQPAAA